MVHHVRSSSIKEMSGDLPPALTRYRQVVHAPLRQALASNDTGLYDMLRYHLGWMDVDGRPVISDSGKALRSALTLLACEWAGGRWQDAISTAVALELIHNFSLIHDDIQDGDTERRHRPTVWSVWGRPKAIVAGNAMLCLADRTLLALPEDGSISDLVALELARVHTKRCLEMIEGQYLDLSFETSLDVTVNQYLDMVARKTGALIDCAMFMGALVATRDVEVARTFGRCGLLLGLAFQIRDDLLGVWGNAHDTGKATGADIQRRKKSLPAVHALERTRGDDRDAIRSIYAQDTLSDNDVSRVLKIMNRVDTYNFGQELAEAKGREALSALAGFPMGQTARREFDEVVMFLVARQH